jgi:hypothetical protein
MKTTSIPDTIHVSILVTKKDGDFVAHCLEMDIVTTARTLDGSVRDVIDLIVAHVTFACENDNAEYIYSPAPPEVWHAFAQAQRRKECAPERHVEHLPTAGRPDLMLEADRFCYA